MFQDERKQTKKKSLTTPEQVKIKLWLVSFEIDKNAHLQ